MTNLSFYSNIVNADGSFKDLGAATPRDIAEVLAVKSLTHYRDPCLAEECQAGFFASRICREIGPIINQYHLNGMDCRFSVSLDYHRGTLWPQSDIFVSTARDFILHQPDFIQKMKNAQQKSKDLKFKEKATIAAFLICAGAWLVYHSDLLNFAWWKQIILGAVPALGGLYQAEKAAGQEVRAVIDLESAANRLVVHRWALLADSSFLNLSLSHDWPDPRLPLNSIIVGQSDPQETAAFMQNVLRPKSGNPAGSLSVEVRSDLPNLSGTCLKMKFYPKAAPAPG